MNFIERRLKKWLLSFLFVDGLKVGTHTILIYPDYIDMGNGKFQNIGNFVGNVIPDANNTYDVGSVTSRWKNAYITSLNSSGPATIGGVTTITGATTINGTTTHNGASVLAGTLSVSGLTSLNGYINANIIPNADATYSIGNASTKFYYHVPVTASVPTASINYLGRLITVRIGSGNKSYLYQCVQNSSNGYEWLQIGVST